MLDKAEPEPTDIATMTVQENGADAGTPVWKASGFQGSAHP
jgi:hypothetical protein